MLASGQNPDGTTATTIPGSSTPSQLNVVANDWLSAPGLVSGTYLGAQATIYFMPIFLPAGHSIQTLGVYVNTGGTIGAICRLGIYADNSGMPGSLIIDAGAVGTVPTGFVGLTITPPAALLTGGTFHLCACPQGAPTTQATFIQNQGDPHVRYPAAAGGTANGQGILIVSGVASNLPATITPPRFPGGSGPFGQAPNIYYQVT